MAEGEPPYPAQVQGPLPNPTIIHLIRFPGAAFALDVHTLPAEVAAGLVLAHAAKVAG